MVPNALICPQNRQAGCLDHMEHQMTGHLLVELDDDLAVGKDGLLQSSDWTVAPLGAGSLGFE